MLKKQRKKPRRFLKKRVGRSIPPPDPVPQDEEYGREPYLEYLRWKKMQIT